jgi:hypothetical protein
MAVRAVDCRSTPWLMLVMLLDHQDATMMLVVQQVGSGLLTQHTTNQSAWHGGSERTSNHPTEDGRRISNRLVETDGTDYP